VQLTQLCVQLARADVRRAEALLNLAEPLALCFSDAADSPLFEPAPGETPLWPDLIIHALFPAEFDAEGLSSILIEALPALTRVDSRAIEESDWRGGLEQDVFVQRVAANLCVVPAEFDGEPPAGNPVRVHMGLAFGTGRHPTTLLCLEWLARQPPVNLSVCDFGCGSGILAIAALKLGAARAIAIDNDPQAITATRANAALNKVADQLSAGVLEEFPVIDVDIVLANILAGTLENSVTLIAAMLRPAGRIVLSGILEDQAHAVERAFAARFESFDTEVRDGWTRIAARLR
jgi:ribosomal protein L11 methyltransferase